MGLKFKKIGEYNGDIVDTILENRKIEDINLFLNPDESSNTNPFDIENMLQAVSVLSAHLTVRSKMAIVVDADADGYLSASMMYQYLKKLDSTFDIDFIIQDKKVHGLSEHVMDRLAEKVYELVIIPDAGSNDIRELDMLYAMGCEVLVLDHHIVEELPTSGIIVNNQLNDKSNKNLVGVGVVFKFLLAFDHMTKQHGALDLVDLVAIGQVADSSDISENEVRNLVFHGIKNINNSFVKEALKMKDKIQPVPKDLSYSVIPLINAVIRVGTYEEKETMFRALNNINPEVTIVEKKKKNKETGKFDKIQVPMNLQQFAVDTAVRCKSRQDALVKKAVASVEKSYWSEGGVAIAVTDFDESYGPLTGLIATKMVNKVQKPFILLRDKGKVLSGSGRGYEPTMSSLKDWTQGTEVAEYARGHNQAFGLELKKDNLDSFKEKATKIEAKDFEYEVDFVSYGDVDPTIIKELDDNNHIFGGRVSDPLFAYVGVDVPKKDIRAKGTILTFSKNGVDFVMYGSTPELIDKYTGGFAASHKLDFIGRPGVNDFLGRVATQVVLEAVDFNNGEDETDEVTEFNIVF